MTDWDPRALEVLRRLWAAGHQAVLVGGCVRDSLLSLPPHDYDAATSARPEETVAACAGLRCMETGLKHGTVTVLFQGLAVEVTTFRREGAYSDHRHPDEVVFTDNLAQDLARRDFTVNAIAWGQEGLVDPFGGQRDLAAHLLRCVGNPDRRFEEDALRLLRGLRLAAQLELVLHPDTAAAVRRHSSQLVHVAWERISAEFLRLICLPGAGQILLEFPEVTTQLLPELAPAVGFDQRNPHHCWDVYTHCVKTLECVPPKPALRLAALLHDTGKPSVFTLDEGGVGHFYGHPARSAALTNRALSRLRLDNATRVRTVMLVEHHHLDVIPTEAWAGRWLARLGEEPFFDLLALKRGDALASVPKVSEPTQLSQAEASARALLSRRPCLSRNDLAVNGHDALSVGLSGYSVGRALRALLEQVVEGALPNERTVLLSQLSQLAEAENR